MIYKCSDCPRNCGALRSEKSADGICASPAVSHVVRAAPHFGEEPCISGDKGSGAVFFSGCNLRCVFCQNREISRSAVGKELNSAQLRELFLRLRDTGVHNINLVTPSHYVREIAKALDGLDLGIPVVWNSSGYDKAQSLKMLEGLVQIYMPDLKYLKSDTAKRYSAAPDYPAVASAALKEMYRQVGPYKTDESGILKSGLLIRHLILPGQELNTMDVIDFVAEEFPKGSVLFSLMSQYTPMPSLTQFPELQKTIDDETSRNLRSYMMKMGIEDGYWQESSSATEEMIPDFDLTGLENL